MLKKFYIHLQAQESGGYEMHVENCRHLPQPEQRLYIGGFATAERALTAAVQYYSQVDACKFCLAVYHQQAVQGI